MREMLRDMRARVGVVAVSLVMTMVGNAVAQPKGQAKAPAKPAAPAGPKPLSETLTGDAKADYDAGRSLFDDSDFAAAALKFQSAYDKAKDPRLLWNIAGCERNDHHYSRAIALVRRYVDTGGALLNDQDRADAKELIDTIQQFTILLTIKVDQPDAEISIDDAVVGISPLAAPQMVDIGPRRVVVKKSGFREYSSTQRYDGKSATVDVKLEPEVHEGELRVTTAANARVFLDGKEVGIGSFRGRVSTGGHTLRVAAPGMQTYQSEVVVADNETRALDVPLNAEVDVAKIAAAPRPDSYDGFYGKFATAVSFGVGTTYVLPPSAQGDRVGIGTYFRDSAKLALGYAFGWFGLEGVAAFSFRGSPDTFIYDATGARQIKADSWFAGLFVGAGPRVTSKHRVIRFTTGLALGVAPHQAAATDFKYDPCSGSNNPSCTQGGNPSNPPSPGFTAFAMNGDLGILLGNGSPGAKFWIGLDWYLEVPPDVTIGPITDTRIPAKYLVNQGATILHGPQFFIGPVLGVCFGH